MKRIYVLIVLLIAVTIVIVILQLHRRPPSVPGIAFSSPARHLPLTGVTVILDPGHGGADPGANCDGITEASLTYRTAVETAVDLRARGATVIYTVRSRALLSSLAVSEPLLEDPRDALLAATGRPIRIRRGGSPVTLWQRTRPARLLWRGHADTQNQVSHNIFFVSLHYDDSHHDDVHGGLVCVDRRRKSVPALGRTLAAALVAHHLARNSYWHGLHGVSGRKLGVLDPRYNPLTESVLLEVATLSNLDDQTNVLDPEWRAQIAQIITDAIQTVHDQRT